MSSAMPLATIPKRRCIRERDIPSRHGNPAEDTEFFTEDMENSLDGWSNDALPIYFLVPFSTFTALGSQHVTNGYPDGCIQVALSRMLNEYNDVRRKQDETWITCCPIVGCSVCSDRHSDA